MLENLSPSHPIIGASNMGYTVLAAVPDGGCTFIVAAQRSPDRFVTWRMHVKSSGTFLYEAGDYSAADIKTAVCQMVQRAGYF